MTLFGGFSGNDISALNAFETWLGRPVDEIQSYGGRANWSDWIGSIGWNIGNWAPLDRPLYWTIPLFPTGGTLAAAASGAYDSYYMQAANLLASTRQQDDVIHIRIGEEFNGGWMPWAAQGHEQEFIATYQHFVDLFRSVSDRFVFEWNVNIGDWGMNPANAYPGDNYVDIIGMDFYYNTTWDPQDPAAAWNYMVNRTYGLQWLENFAAAHGKPTAYTEWGVNADEAGVYIEHAAEWFASHDVVYQAYWNLNSGFNGWLSGGLHPGTGAAYIAAFRPQGVEHWTNGTAADETFIGTDQDDYIDGSGGNDTITGGAGSDVLNGGLGNDGLNGGAGNDVLISGAGNDTVSGGGGNDQIEGGPGDDTLSGGNGADRMRGGAGNDIINGGADADSLAGDGGNDAINGGPGNDTAWYGGSRSQYQITKNPDGSLHIVDFRANSPDGADDVRNVELLHFADGTVTVGVMAVSDPSSAGLTAVATGDFNGDGTDDFLWRNDATGATSEQLMSGGGATVVEGKSAAGLELVGAHDFNGDGATDVMWRDPGNSATITWLFNHPTASDFLSL